MTFEVSFARIATFQSLLLQYLSVLTAMMLPVYKTFEAAPLMDVSVMELERDSVGYDIGNSRQLGDSEGYMIQFQVEPEKYAAAVNWLRTMMFDSVFDPIRIKAARASSATATLILPTSLP